MARCVAEVLFAGYKSKFIFPTGEYGIFGYGNLACARFCLTYGDNTNNGAAIEVGNYGDISRNIKILLGGEHNNSEVINGNLIMLQNLRQKTIARGVAHHKSLSKGKVKIGSNVLIGQGAFIKSGITIGDGAVIAAEAVVTRDVPDFAIVAGNPAKVIKYRFSDEVATRIKNSNWWSMHPSELADKIEIVQNLNKPDFDIRLLSKLAYVSEVREASIGEPETYSNVLEDSRSTATSKFATEVEFGEKSSIAFENKAANHDKYIVLKASQIMRQPDSFASFEGVEINGKFTPTDKLPEIFRAYVSQLDLPVKNEFYVTDNIFELSPVLV